MTRMLSGRRLATWQGVLLGVVALSPAACELDRRGLDYSSPPAGKDAATLDAPFLRGDHAGGAGGFAEGGLGGDLGEAGGATGSGGAVIPPGAGGDINGVGGATVAGTGGDVNGVGGAGAGGSGSGGTTVAGSGGAIIAPGTGGLGPIGTGGAPSGTGGAVVKGTGGAIVMTGTGGMFIKGTGGAIVPPGTGGQPAFGCNAQTCPDGCCAGNQCVTQLTAKQCGHGAVCQACAACQRCSAAGACEVDPASQWDLVAASATLNRNDPYYATGTGAWDSAGELYGGARPDPFCQLEMPVGTPIYGTNSIVDSLVPAWNQSLAAPGTTLTASDLLPGGQNWQIWVGDDDGNGVGEVMCEIDAPITADDFKAGGFMRTNVGSKFSSAPSCTSVTFKLICRP